jgi:hypothetical protein
MSKNQKQLESFTAYCKAYPDLRFWQALCNWSGAPKIAKGYMTPEGMAWEDTYYEEEK